MTDVTGWIRSGFQSLSQTAPIQYVERVPDAAVTVNVDLLKAYVMKITNETRSASVVVRVRYGKPNSQPDEKIYRGTTSNVNWFDGSSESASSFNDALSQILKQASVDFVAHCK